MGMKSTRTSDSPKLGRATLQAMRQQAVKAIREGQDVTSMAASYGVNERSVYRRLAQAARDPARLQFKFTDSIRRCKKSMKSLGWCIEV
ncbi:hypothetical protein WK92_11715 [Burkholderia ubonensis]|nr:hypothetical protein WK82_27170 [Burkholderia ubonensis]KVW23706.1 hypothetical protein WK92_11715 [Burkholderia ubonensis]